VDGLDLFVLKKKHIAPLHYSIRKKGGVLVRTATEEKEAGA
jgi:hypothetical protein